MRVNLESIGVLGQKPQSILAVLKQLMKPNLLIFSQQAIIDTCNGNSLTGELLNDQIAFVVNDIL